jgi:hypothetical protein
MAIYSYHPISVYTRSSQCGILLQNLEIVQKTAILVVYPRVNV